MEICLKILKYAGIMLKTFTHKKLLTLYSIEMPFDSFANRAEPDKAVLARAA